MAHGLPRSLSRASAAGMSSYPKTISISSETFDVAGASGVGFGSIVIGDLPAGNILLQGAVGYFQFTGPTDANLSDTWEGDYSIGTTPASDGTLSGADEDIVAETAIAAATAEASPKTRATNAVATAGTVVDNTDGSLEINLSLLIDDADIGADDITITVSGQLYLSYLVLGDD